MHPRRRHAIQMRKNFLDWLRNAPIHDPIDRRNAPTMQALLLFYGVTLTANWIWTAYARPIPQQWTIVLLLDALTIAVAFAGVALIRVGRFRLAVMLYLACLVLTSLVTFRRLGTTTMLIDQTGMILILVISGLVLGRRALWLSYGLVLAVFTVGYVSDARSQKGTEWIIAALSNAPGLMLSYTVITLILDRTVAALRQSLAEADARSRALAEEMAERERTQAQLIQSQKMEATGRLAAGVAHDFGNLLNVIRGFARERDSDAHLSKSARTAALEQALEGVEQAADRGLATTRKLLTFNRNDLLKLEWFDPGKVIRELQPMLRQLFPAEVRLRLDIPASTPRIRLDRSEFELMLLNVAANARDAMPDGGCFDLMVRQPSPALVEIAMRDDGHGMDARVLERVFEPFFSTKPASRGTGLGLSVIHDLVNAAGGTIEVESAPGQGTCVRIRFPCE